MPRSYSTCRMSTGGRCPFRKPMSANPQGGGETATAEVSDSDSDGNSAPPPAKRERTESDDSSDSDSNSDCDSDSDSCNSPPSPAKRQRTEQQQGVVSSSDSDSDCDSGCDSDSDSGSYSGSGSGSYSSCNSPVAAAATTEPAMISPANRRQLPQVDEGATMSRHDTVVITEEAHYYYGMEAELIGIDEDDGILKLTDGDIKIVKMAALAKKAGQQQQQQQQERADSSGYMSASASSEDEGEEEQQQQQQQQQQPGAMSPSSERFWRRQNLGLFYPVSDFINVEKGGRAGDSCLTDVHIDLTGE